ALLCVQSWYHERVNEGTLGGLAMRRLFGVALAAGVLGLPSQVSAQDTPAAKATRARLKKIKLDEVAWTDERTRVIFAGLKREADDKVSFHVDTTTGMSMNTRMTYKAKNVTLEQVLNDLADKNDFGWFVMSNAKDRYDGWIILRKGKGKERGYEAGKEPKEKSSALPAASDFVLLDVNNSSPALREEYRQLAQTYYQRLGVLQRLQ